MDKALYASNATQDMQRMSPSVAKRRLREACKGFEALLIHEMMKSMRKTIPKSGLMGGGAEEKIYEAMYDQAVSDVLADRGALGVADMLYMEFLPRVSATGGNGKR